MKIMYLFQSYFVRRNISFHNLHNWKRDLFQIGMYWIIYSSLILPVPLCHHTRIHIYHGCLICWYKEYNLNFVNFLYDISKNEILCFLSCPSQQQKLENITLVNRSISRNIKKHVGRYWFVLIFTNLYTCLRNLYWEVSHHGSGCIMAMDIFLGPVP